MKFCNTFIALVFFINVLDSSPASVNRFKSHYTYTYVQEAASYFSYHYVPATWRDAELRCQYEGATLASPYPKKIRDALLDLMNKRNSSGAIFTGINSLISKGEFNTVDGFQLSQASINWTDNEPDNYNNEEECVIFTSEGLAADKKCDRTYPYYCYKTKTPAYENYLEDINGQRNPCGTPDNGYTYSNLTEKCYKFHKIAHIWNEAYIICYYEGGHFAIINSDQEAEAIKKLFAEYPDNTIVGGDKTYLAFIGYSDWTGHGDWRTFEGQTISEAGYDKFAPGEPNNRDNKEYCGSVLRSGLLYDAACYSPLAFICEKNPIIPNGNPFIFPPEQKFPNYFEQVSPSPK